MNLRRIDCRKDPPRPVTSIISAHWSGPLPPPAELEKIDQIIPGGADRLLSMAENEQTHRIADAKRGQYLGWSLAAGAAIAAAVVSLCHGPWQVPVALAGIPVLSMEGGRPWFLLTHDSLSTAETDVRCVYKSRGARSL